MPLIHILRDGPDPRVEDDVEEALLVKTTGVIDNEHEYTTWVEYRFPGSDVIVHRSAHVTIKKWPDALSGAVGAFN